MKELGRREFIGLSTTGLALAGSVKSEGLNEKSKDKNQILILYDNIVYEPEDAIPNWGFSAYITYNGKTILFDTGTYPDILKHNAKVLGADLTSVDIAIISHIHGDHIGGLDYFMDVNPHFTLLLPNDGNIGGETSILDKTYSRGYNYRHKNTQFITDHTDIAVGMHIIATTSPIVGTSWGYPPNEDKPLFTGLPELSLALESKNGQFTLVSGCSHSKIEEIVKVTKQHLGKDVSLVIGGFHHIPYSSEYVTSIAKMMKDELGVEKIACSHCTGEEAVKTFQDIYKDDFCDSGLGSRLQL
ncbi:MBL fold metallo-hydrolase [Candidatus Latescibacterota bacterium]